MLLQFDVKHLDLSTNELIRARQVIGLVKVLSLVL